MTSESIDAYDIALLVGRSIVASGGAYFVGGSLASSLQGEPRATNDIDIVLELPFGAVDHFRELLGTDFEVDVSALRTALRTGTSCNVFYLPHVTKIDLFGVGPTPFDEIEFGRRQAVRVRGSEDLWVKSPEDTVLRKLLWYREGGMVSDRQWRDVVRVLAVSGSVLDGSYLDAWATRLGLVELLARARKQRDDESRKAR